MSKVLLLNIDYEPLNMCDLQRALKLMYVGKASAIHFYENINFKTTDGKEVTIPSVIRMNYHIKKKHSIEYRVSRTGIYNRDNHTCQYCGRKDSELTLDHVYPRHLGGSHTWDNLVTCCRKCNHNKAGKTLDKCNMKLLSKPKSPRFTFKAMVSHSAIEQNEVWSYYIYQ